mgnify:CR=1 FL=1
MSPRPGVALSSLALDLQDLVGQFKLARKGHGGNGGGKMVPFAADQGEMGVRWVALK